MFRKMWESRSTWWNSWNGPLFDIWKKAIETRGRISFSAELSSVELLLYDWEDALANLANFGWRSGVFIGVDGNCEKLLPCVDGVELLNNDGYELLAESGVLGAGVEAVGGCALSPRISSRITFRQLINFASSKQRRTCLCRMLALWCLIPVERTAKSRVSRYFFGNISETCFVFCSWRSARTSGATRFVS